MQRTEAAKGFTTYGTSVSRRVLESWRTNRFWFDFAMRKPIDAEVIFDNCLNEEGRRLESLDEDTRAGLASFVDLKMEQLKAYDSDCKRLL